MDSAVLKSRGIGLWMPVSVQRERSVLAALPASPGVYVFRLPTPQPRFRGESDIAYIGKATNANGLRGRVRQYFHPGPTQTTNIAMRSRLTDPVCALQLGFVVLPTGSHASALEAALLTEFEAEHGQLPHYNRQRALPAFATIAPAPSVGSLERFRIIAFDEGGVAGSPDNLRLVCVLEGGGKLAIWGRLGHDANIRKVVQVVLPCTVECEFRPPGKAQAAKFGHTHWVPEDCQLNVLAEAG